ncbi:MAG TPA: hypothetical protein VFP53_04290 [Sphingomicrobium sp.]|nr:hypothetical protein [Sphingomicrobium sp.]
MSAIAALLLTAAQPYPLPPPAQEWQPTARYIAPGQDEPGYRNWYIAAPWHPAGVKAFNDYLTAWGVGGIVPTWQLLRTASDWRECGAPAFEIPPAADWPNIVQTLRYIRDDVIPAVGPVEPVSVYRNPQLNICAGGAPGSAHRYASAIDLVPLRPTTREALIHDLCALHAATGEPYGVGLGFYAFLRFHVDSTRFRKWGFGNLPEAAPCRNEPPSVTVAQKPGDSVPAAVPDAEDREPK